MGNYPSMGTKGGTVIGGFELNFCYDACDGECNAGGGPWYNCCKVLPIGICEGACCKGIQAPTGPEWEKAKDGFAPFLEEGAATAFKNGGCCMDVFKAKDGFAPFLEEGAAIAFKSGAPLSCVQGGCVQCGCMDVFKAKAALDADWTNRANTYLADHGLQVEVCAYYTSDGKSSTPHLFIQFSKPA